MKLTPTQRYRLHYNLKKKGNKVNTKLRMITKRNIDVSPIEKKWLNMLISYGYCVCNDMFTPPPKLIITIINYCFFKINHYGK